MLAELLSSKTAYQVLLHLFHYGETYAAAVAQDFSLSIGQVQRQLSKFENCGVLESRLVGRTRAFRFNPKSPYMEPVKTLVKISYNAIPLNERKQLFKTRRRPRRSGKPVISR